MNKRIKLGGGFDQSKVGADGREPLTVESTPHFYIAGKIVKAGQRIVDFRGDKETFLRVSRDSEPGKSGKVLVKRGTFGQEFYPSVFNGEIR